MKNESQPGSKEHHYRGSLEHIDLKPEKSGLTTKQKLGIGILAVITAVGGGSVAANALRQDHSTKIEAPANPGPSAKASIDATPTPEKSVAETVPTVESLEVNASLLKDPKALIDTFVDERTTEWFNAGATPENAQAALDSNTENIDEFATRIAAKYDKMFIDALLVKDWQSNPNIVKWVDNMIFIHRTTLALYFYTSFPDINSQDKEPYRRYTKHAHIDSTANQTNKSVTIIDTEQNFDNADLNRVGEDLTAGKKVGNEIGKVTRTFIVEGGKIKISDSALLALE